MRNNPRGLFSRLLAGLAFFLACSALQAQSAAQSSGARGQIDLSAFARQAVASSWECASAAQDLRKSEEAYELARRESRALFDIETARIDSVTKGLRLLEAKASAVIDAVTAYVSMLQAERTRDINLRTLAMKQQYAQSAAGKMKEGAIQEDDYLDQALAEKNAQLALLSSEGALAKARRQLLRVGNLDASGPIAVSPTPASIGDEAAAQAMRFDAATLVQKARTVSSAYIGSALKLDYARRRHEAVLSPLSLVSEKEKERLFWELQTAEHTFTVQSAALDDTTTDLLAQRDYQREALALAEQRRAGAEKKLAAQRLRLSYNVIVPLDVVQYEIALASEESSVLKARDDILIQSLRICAAAGVDILELLSFSQ